MAAPLRHQRIGPRADAESSYGRARCCGRGYLSVIFDQPIGRRIGVEIVREATKLHKPPLKEKKQLIICFYPVFRL